MVAGGAYLIDKNKIGMIAPCAGILTIIGFFLFVILFLLTHKHKK
jgi:uncharacterized membrane protein YgdD (TMEM256/DUF423 family)